MKAVIVGGVAGGATAAARIRRLDEKAEIIIFEKSGYISYANCGLPYYIGGVITDREELTLQTPESFFARFGVRAKVYHEVTALHPEQKTVTVKNLRTGEVFEESYDKLLLSPGAKPAVPDLPGIASEGIFTLRNVEDTFRIKDFVDTRRPKTAVIVGGGYIGLEMAENLTEAGVEVTVVQRPGQLMNTLDFDMAAAVHAKMREKGVKLLLSTDVTGFLKEGEALKVFLKGKEPLTVDTVLLAVGVTPETSLAKAAGLKLGIKGSILVNDRMETSVPDIYAVGDAVQAAHFITRAPASIALAGPANKQGRVAADNICGLESRYKGSLGSSIIKIFDMIAASTGLTEKAAKAAGLSYEKIVLSPSSHAGYYPGAKTLRMKIVYEKGTRRLLGAQATGYEGVDKRIDVLATAISAGITADGLKELDLAYAPPYSSAKDPVNMAGFMAENIENGLVKQFHWDEIASLPRDGSVTLLDTRTPAEYARGHAEGFINIPVDELRERLGEIDKSKPLYVMCQSGLRSYISCRILAQEGFDCYNFSGGYSFYSTVTREALQAEETFPCGMEKSKEQQNP